MKTNNIDKVMADELPAEILFDYTKAKPNRFTVQEEIPQSVMVALDPDVAEVFGTADAVNRALRALIEGAMPALPDAVSRVIF